MIPSRFALGLLPAIGLFRAVAADPDAGFVLLFPPEGPHKGHIGFQELSRGGGHVQIRNARIKIIE